jgi:hypothetical protein
MVGAVGSEAAAGPGVDVGDDTTDATTSEAGRVDVGMATSGARVVCTGENASDDGPTDGAVAGSKDGAIGDSTDGRVGQTIAVSSSAVRGARGRVASSVTPSSVAGLLSMGAEVGWTIGSGAGVFVVADRAGAADPSSSKGHAITVVISSASRWTAGATTSARSPVSGAVTGSVGAGAAGDSGSPAAGGSGAGGSEAGGSGAVRDDEDAAASVPGSSPASAGATSTDEALHAVASMSKPDGADDGTVLIGWSTAAAGAGSTATRLRVGRVSSSGSSTPVSRADIAPTGSRSDTSSAVGSSRVGSTRLGSTRVGSTRVGSTAAGARLSTDR